MKEGTKKAGGGGRASGRMSDERDAQFPSKAKKDDKTAPIAANHSKRRVAKGRGGALALALAAEEEEEGRDDDDDDDDDGKRPSSGIRPAKSPLDSKERGPPPPPLVNYSPNSILAVRAAHAKTDGAAPATAAHRPRPPPLSTASIGYSPSLPPGTLSPNEKKRRHSRELERKRSRTASVQVSLIGPPPSPAARVARDGGGGGPERKKKRASLATAGCAAATQKMTKAAALAGGDRGADGAAAVEKSRGASSSSSSSSSSSGGGGGRGKGVSDQPAVVSIQSLYKREIGKAGEFVDYMTTGPTAASTTATKSKSTNNNSGKKAGAETKASSSPESSADDGDLELKLDRE